jgi:hypothetical protein
MQRAFFSRVIPLVAAFVGQAGCNSHKPEVPAAIASRDAAAPIETTPVRSWQEPDDDFGNLFRKPQEIPGNHKTGRHEHTEIRLEGPDGTFAPRKRDAVRRVKIEETSLYDVK